MSGFITKIGTGTAVGLLVLAAGGFAGEIPTKSAPRPVLDAVAARFKTAKVVLVAREKTPEGTTVYEVGLKEKGKTIDLMLTPEGAITLIEKQIDFKDLPAAVAGTFEREYPKARYKLVEEVYKVEDGKELLAHYEALLTDAKKQVAAVEVATDGKVLKVEKKKSLTED